MLTSRIIIPALIIVTALVLLILWIMSKNEPPLKPEKIDLVAQEKIPKERHTLQINCTDKTTCKQMTSCQEALFYLNQCGVKKLDRDNDAIPCEQQWCKYLTSSPNP